MPAEARRVAPGSVRNARGTARRTLTVAIDRRKSTQTRGRLLAVLSRLMIHSGLRAGHSPVVVFLDYAVAGPRMARPPTRPPSRPGRTGLFGFPSSSDLRPAPSSRDGRQTILSVLAVILPACVFRSSRIAGIEVVRQAGRDAESATPACQDVVDARTSCQSHPTFWSELLRSAASPLARRSPAGTVSHDERGHRWNIVQAQARGLHRSERMSPL
jgi:hypothetical protein